MLNWGRLGSLFNDVHQHQGLNNSRKLSTASFLPTDADLPDLMTSLIWLWCSSSSRTIPATAIACDCTSCSGRHSAGRWDEGLSAASHESVRFVSTESCWRCWMLVITWVHIMQVSYVIRCSPSASLINIKDAGRVLICSCRGAELRKTNGIHVGFALRRNDNRFIFVNVERDGLKHWKLLSLVVKLPKETSIDFVVRHAQHRWQWYFTLKDCPIYKMFQSLGIVGCTVLTIA